jgi:hypothetical protein
LHGPYVAGDSLDRALPVVQKLWRERGLMSTLDLLVEDIENDAQAQRNLETYLRMVDAVAALQGFPKSATPSLSLKPSSYTTRPLHAGGDAKGAAGAILAIASRATERGMPSALAASWKAARGPQVL